MMAKRETYVGRRDYDAECRDCTWTLQARNALGPAARHHDKTGHTVRVQVEYAIYYGPIR